MSRGVSECRLEDSWTSFRVCSELHHTHKTSMQSTRTVGFNADLKFLRFIKDVMKVIIV
jgi:hypothetical protein